MFSARQSLETILLRREVIRREQLAKAQQVQKQTGARLEDVLIRLGYASAADVAVACAESLGIGFLDLGNVQVASAVIELVPESVARENCILPVAFEAPVLVVATADPASQDILQKLEFILNRPVRPVLAYRAQIIEAITRHYGESETQSVDSMLMEFTDTAIDFTETERRATSIDLESSAEADEDLDDTSIDLECSAQAEEEELDDEDLDDDEFEMTLDRDACAKPEAAPEVVGVRRKRGRFVDRRATVRFYQRMNPERLFPLLVVLSEKTIQEVVRRGVAQKQSKAFQVAEDSLVEIEPILPGCDCYPPREQVRVTRGEMTANFWVVPHVLGRLMHARVVVRQDGQVLAEVPLEARVVKQSLTMLLGALSLVLPFGLLLLKQMHLDFESQMQDGFGLYAQAAGFLLGALTPELLTGLLLAATGIMYLALRPRKRDVFWDVTPAEPEKTAVSQDGPVATGPETILEDLVSLLKRADEAYEAKDYATAFRLYERAGTGSRKAIHYFRASISAYRCGNTARALGILKEAETRLSPQEMKGSIWYNMGCFATRLGRFAEALQYLNRAVDAGYNNVEKYLRDPDLEPLRWQAGFKRLLVGLGG